MAFVTALRERAGGRIAVELDGAPWRTLPQDVVVRAGLVPGVELDRPRVRKLRRALRRSEALAAAARALRARDLSTRGLDERLERRGVAAGTRAKALETLERAGLVDDERFAFTRASSLAARGRGDAAIRWTLEHEGVTPDLVARALEALEPERARAGRIVADRGSTSATARFLAARGFAEEAVEAALGGEFGAGDGAALG